MPTLIAIPADVKTKDQIIIGDCTTPQGHCYGSDGGSGIPQKNKVSPYLGGTIEVWTLDQTKTQIQVKEKYDRCQYCQKYTLKGTVNDQKQDSTI